MTIENLSITKKDTFAWAEQDTILTPRFYTTDFDELDSIDVSSVRAEWDALIAEMESDPNKGHFKKNEDWDHVDWENMEPQLKKEFIDFLISSCTAEFSGCVLYKEMKRRGNNKDICELFAFMSRDEARHAGFINDALREAGIDGDARALVLGARWFDDNWYLASVASRLDNHEATDEGNYFDAWGWEVYGQYRLSGNWWVTGRWNLLRPDDDRDQAGDYRIRFGVLGLRYALKDFDRYLYANLQMMEGQHVMFGMHDPTGYGVGWSYNDDRSDVHDVCGDFPAVSSWATRHRTTRSSTAASLVRRRRWPGRSTRSGRSGSTTSSYRTPPTALAANRATA